MVICSTMESVYIPRPPALPARLLVSPYDTPMPLKSSQPKPKTSPKPSEEETMIINKKITQTKDIVSRNTSLRSKISNRSVVSNNGFRLIDSNNNNNDETGSVYSIYKQKIDSMFESDSSNSQSSNKNSVQAKIEKMFNDVAKDSVLPARQMGVHSFSVDYLGSVPLEDKVTSLSGLQTPLKELYFSYKKVTDSRKVLSGRLEISPGGLKVQYQGEKGELEQVNTFSTIAVWSAVKFVVHGTGSSSTYAFLPLITDPENIDKQKLFKNLEGNEKDYVKEETHSPLFAVVMRKIGLHKQLECHGFVCQTSEDAIVIAATLYKSLVNHMKNKERKPKNKNGVTTCMSTTSSVVADVPVRPPRKKRSTTSSVTSEKSDLANISDTQPLLSSAYKAPKKSIKSRKAPKAPEPNTNENPDAILPYEDPIKPTDDNVQKKVEEIKPKTFADKLDTYMSREQKQITEEIKQVVSDTNKGLKRVKSLRRRNDESLMKKENTGDILTKVTIPRSGSFLNTGGLTRYKNSKSRNNESASGGSPLGFKEIFNELSIQEGLHSMDDILSVIIDPDGMSFNDLKPIYKEFLLKLAVTLTKDELYQRSKTIMRRQKKKMLTRSSGNNAKKSHHILVGGKFKRLKHIFQKNIKMKMAQNNRKLEKKGRGVINGGVDQHVDLKLPESSISTSSYDTRQFRPREDSDNANKKQSYRNRRTGDPKKRRDRTSTSEESDFFSLKRNKSRSMLGNATSQNRNSSSGYVSCSECSYDSDTCTCVSADKCYCSLGHKNFNSESKSRSFYPKDTILTYCGCDTDSCAESNKCYCTAQRLKQKELLAPAEPTAYTGQKKKHKKLCKKYSNTKSTKSLEYMANPSEAYYEKLNKSKFGTERQYVAKHNHKNRRSSHIGIGIHQNVSDFGSIVLRRHPYPGHVLGRHSVSATQLDTSGGLGALEAEFLQLARLGNARDVENLQRMMYGGCGCDKDQFADVMRRFDNDRTRKTSNSLQQSPSVTTGACTEALSVKKSAEIAALFADIKLSQTTDITHLAPYDRDSRHSSRTYSSTRLVKYSKPIKNDNKLVPNQKPSLIGGQTHGQTKRKNSLYSARNGLYTIQSQSDESRRSSLSEGKKFSNNKKKDEREYFDVERFSNRNVSSNIESSLGYLP